MPLVGIMFGNIISSITAFIAYKEDLLQNLSGWLQGDFSLVMSGRYELLYFSIPTLIVAYLFAHRFSIVAVKRLLIFAFITGKCFVFAVIRHHYKGRVCLPY